MARYVQSFRDEAIRPHVGGNYGDMLRASLWHPAMQYYLTQANSIGPDSVAGRRRGRGLNENLAREFLELHSMRVGYTQDDVTQLAMLLAGMASDEAGQRVDPRRAQPGIKRILGRAYGDRDPKAEIDRLVATVALRPETAQNVAFTLARHFIADEPPADLVDALAAAYLAHDGDLPPVYRVLLEHPLARDGDTSQAALAAGLCGSHPADLGRDCARGVKGLCQTGTQDPAGTGRHGPAALPRAASRWLARGVRGLDDPADDGRAGRLGDRSGAADR